MGRSRGITLLELLIAMLVTSFAVAGALLMVQAQQRLFYSGSKTRQAQQNGRAALLYLEQKIPLAGYGMDPADALDFSWYGCAGACTRDATNGPDELVFYARNPAARVIDGTPDVLTGNVWQVQSLAGDTLTVVARAGDTFRKGQIVQIVCRNQFWFTHVTLAATVANAPAGNLPLALVPTGGTLSPNTPANPFTRQDVADPVNAIFSKWNACATATPRAFLVDRYRFYVRPVDMGNGRFDPYLVLDQGIDVDLDGVVDQNDETLVAEGIENFQVAYQFLDPTLPKAGLTPGTQIQVPAVGSAPSRLADTITPTNFPGPFDGAARFPLFQSSKFFTSSGSPLLPVRQTNDQGNLRAVQIAIVARSPEPDPSGQANLKYDPAGSPLWVMNANQLPAWMGPYDPKTDRYLRAVLSTTIELDNLSARGLPTK